MLSENGSSAPLAKKQKSKKQKAKGTAELDDEYDEYMASTKLGGVDAACCQLLFGHEVSTVNQRKLFDTSPVKVANNLVNRIVYEDDERGHVSAIKRSSPRLPGARFEAEVEGLFRYVLEHSKEVAYSFSGQQPYEPWIADFCKAVRKSKDLRDVESVPTVADTIKQIAEVCLQSVDQQKLAEVQQKSVATHKRKAAHDAELSQRLGFGGHPVPKAGGTLTRQAGFVDGDFDEHGELLPDSDYEDEGSEWKRKVARYCKLMEQKGEGMDLKGRGPWAPQGPWSDGPLVGLPLVVYYDEDGSDCNKNVPYAATVAEAWYDSDDSPALLVRFDDGTQEHITDEDEWDWV